MLTRPIVVFSPLRPHQDGRQPHRAAGIGADRPGRETGGDRDAGTAARPSGRAMRLQIPRVPRRAEMLVGAPAAHRELDRVGLPQYDHALREKAAGQGGGRRRAAVAPRHRAAGRDAALDVDQVFERDRHAVQRPDRMAGADRLVGRLGGETGVVGIDIDKGVQFRIVRRDARQHCLDDIDRRQAPRRDLGGENMRRQKAGIGVGRACIGGGHDCHLAPEACPMREFSPICVHRIRMESSAGIAAARRARSTEQRIERQRQQRYRSGVGTARSRPISGAAKRRHARNASDPGRRSHGRRCGSPGWPCCFCC